MGIKISIITVNLNNSDGLQLTLPSVLAQDFSSFEHIVIDGGSTDGSRDILEKNTDPRLSWVSGPDDGIYDAMNKGIKKAEGEYILFLNSGDRLFKKSTLKKASKYLSQGTDIVYGDMKISNNGVITNGIMPEEIDVVQMVRDTLWHPVSFIRKELFTKYGLYNTSFRITGDYEFFFRVIIGKRISARHIRQYIAVFDLNGLSSDSRNIDVIRDERERVQKSYLSEIEISEIKNRMQPVKKKSIFRRWFR